jgi:hypothetical protein
VRPRRAAEGPGRRRSREERRSRLRQRLIPTGAGTRVKYELLLLRLLLRLMRQLRSASLVPGGESDGGVAAMLACSGCLCRSGQRDGAPLARRRQGRIARVAWRAEPVPHPAEATRAARLTRSVARVRGVVGTRL